MAIARVSDIDNPMKFRIFKLSSGNLVFCGKSDVNNEKLVEQVGADEFVLHTAMPGSPFCNIKGPATKKDIKEAAVICAKYSQDWRDNKKDVVIHVFKGADIYKNKRMKTGTFGVRKFDEIKVKKRDILGFEKLIEDEKLTS